MGSFMIISGTIQVNACTEVTAIINDLLDLAEGLEQQEVTCEPVEVSAAETPKLDIDINLVGHTSASSSSVIQAKIEEFGHYATEGAKFATEWEGQDGYFFVGSEEQIILGESACALQDIRDNIWSLRGEDITAAIQYIIQDAKLPKLKHSYLNSSDCVCPICEREDSLKIHFLHAEGHLARSRVQCETCQYTWLGHYILIDMTQIRDADGTEVNDGEE